MKQYASIDDTVYFWFAGNDTSGSGGDGASPAADVRLAGAAADAAPVYSPTPVLLSNAGYPAGAYEVAIVASAGNGFAVDNTYAVFCTLAIDAQNPTGFVGSFDTMPVQANTIEVEGADPTDTIRDAVVDDATRIDASALNTLSGHDPGATLTKAGDLMGLAADAITEAKIADNAIAAEHLNATACTKIIDDFETQSQADPTGFHVNVKEINGTAQTANDVGGDVNEILIDTAVIGALGAGLTAVPWNSAWDAEVQSECADALVAVNLDHLIPTASTVSDVAATSTDFDTALAEATNDHYNNQMITFASGVLLGQSRIISDYDGTAKNIVVSPAFTEAPGDGDTFVIIPVFSEVMVGTNSAALASVCTETRLAELDAGNLPINIDSLLGRLTATRGVYLDQLTKMPDILADTNELQTDWANAGRLDTILDACALEATVAALNNITAANVVDEFETQSQADPTGFHVNVKEVNGTAQTANDNSADINEILLDTAVIGALGAGLTAVPWNSAWDAEVESEVNDGLVAFFTSAVQLVDDIWDEELTGATHNIVSSAGRRVRELGAYFITGGTAQAGTVYGITLAAGESATDHIFNRNLIVILAGTGAGQTRTIVDYNGTTKVAVVDRNWWVNPDATSEYSVIPDDTPLVADHGVATAGGNNTITIRSDASATNDTYGGSIIQIMAGTGRGQSRMIDSYNGTTKVVTICSTWITNPDNTSVYVIMPYGVSQVCKISADPLAEIKTQADDALTDIKLDHLIAVADGDDPVNNSIIAMLAASDGDWSGFAIADDSLEAIRDRGDAAWITGAGEPQPTTLQNTTIATLATQVSFTLSAGSADDDAYNGCIVVVEDSATATQKCIGRVLDYTGASKTITLEADPGVFTMAAGDTIDVIAVELTWNAATKALTDKSGFALSAAGIDAFLDEVIGDAVHATPNSVGAMLHAVYCRFMQKRTATDTVEKAYKLDDVTELKSFTLADDDTTTSRT